MKFPKGYLKSLKTPEEYEQAFMEAMNSNLSIASAMAVVRVAFKKGFYLKSARTVFAIY